MDSLTNVLLPASTPPGAGLAAASPLKSLGNFADQSNAETGGLFALLLGQLTVEQPAVAPVVGQLNTAFAAPGGQITDEILPQTGNLLPPELAEISVQASTLPVVADLTTVLPESDELVALQGIPMTAPTTPVWTTPVTTPVTTTVTPGKRSTATPISTTLAGNPLPAQPGATPTPLITPATLPVENVPFKLDNLKFESQTLQPATAPPTALTSPFVAQSPTAALTATAAQPTLSLDHPVTDARWGEQLGERLIWMNESGIGRAALRMNPPELGPLEVRISVVKDEARVSFSVQHGATREALEAAMPRLREMFAAQGLTLSDANVSQHSQSDQQQTAQTDDKYGESTANAGDDHATGETADFDTPGNITVNEGLIDTYA